MEMTKCCFFLLLGLKKCRAPEAKYSIGKNKYKEVWAELENLGVQPRVHLAEIMFRVGVTKVFTAPNMALYGFTLSLVYWFHIFLYMTSRMTFIKMFESHLDLQTFYDLPISSRRNSECLYKNWKFLALKV